MAGLEYGEYERQCAEARAENEAYLDEFESYLNEQGLAESTIRRHLGNVEFYLDTYLLREGPRRMPDGCHAVNGFLGDFFIRECMWSTPSTIRQNAASFKKFYKCMAQRGHIGQEDLDALLSAIRESMPIWIEDCEEFNDPGDDGLDASSELHDILRSAMLRMLGLPEERGDSAPDGHGDPLTRAEAVAFMTLSLFYLTAWDERPLGPEGPVSHRAWKSADWNALDFLREQGLVNCSNKAKSVEVTEEGMAQAREMLAAFGLAHLA